MSGIRERANGGHPSLTPRAAFRYRSQVLP